MPSDHQHPRLKLLVVGGNFCRSLYQLAAPGGGQHEAWAGLASASSPFEYRYTAANYRPLRPAGWPPQLGRVVDALLAVDPADRLGVAAALSLFELLAMLLWWQAEPAELASADFKPMLDAVVAAAAVGARCQPGAMVYCELAADFVASARVNEVGWWLRWLFDNQ